MAAQAEEPLATPAADPSPPLLRRPSPHHDHDHDHDHDDHREEEEKEDSRDTKRRRTCVAALESLETDKKSDCADYSFSFDARSVAPIETTPKFGSFNPVLLLETTTPTPTTTVLESTQKESDESPAEEEETEPDPEGKAEVEEEGEDASEGKNGDAECSKTQ